MRSVSPMNATSDWPNTWDIESPPTHTRNGDSAVGVRNSGSGGWVVVVVELVEVVGDSVCPSGAVVGAEESSPPPPVTGGKSKSTSGPDDERPVRSSSHCRGRFSDRKWLTSCTGCHTISDTSRGHPKGLR